jgi:DNA-binding helix-hairpin-helix protein with protein kinase domain
MNMKSVRISGQLSALGKPLGRGGEGDVYAIADRGDVAVKVYKEHLRTSREGKVRAMVNDRLAERTNLVAFPAAIATDPSGGFAGFTMRLVSGYRPVHELYSPKSRKLHFPAADYRFLVHAAQNVARAVATVHQAGCVIGDFNHSGVLVSKDATVALIDADSFQFAANGRSYPCVVGTEDFTPPELHGLNLGKVERTRAHDNFGLAIAIFQLLGMGKHPYAGRYAGAGDLSLGEAIAKNLFAYSVTRNGTTRTTPPPASIQLSDFSTPVSAAFEAAFGLTPSARPDPATWVSLLGELASNLRQCSKVRTHYFPHAAGGCIWCRLTAQSGVEMFPQEFTAAGTAPAGQPFDLARIAAGIRAVTLPRHEDLLPTVSGDLGSPSTALAEAQRGKKSQYGVGTVTLLIALLGLFGAPKIALLWIGLAVYGLTRFSGSKADPAPLLRAYKEADGRVHDLSLAHLRRIGFTEVFVLRNELDGLISQYQRLDADLTQELARVRSTREDRQHHAFLDTFLIARAKIPGVGPAKRATLAAFGIESAADIDYSAVRGVPGFGDALTGNMLAWRREQEVKFRYNPAPNPADVQAENAARGAVAVIRVDLQNRLRSGLTALQAAPANLMTRKSAVDPALNRALVDRAKIARDCRTFGIALPASASIIIPMPKAQSAAPSPFSTSRGQHAAPMPSPAPSRPRPAPSNAAPTCPICGSSMLQRMARRGRKTGTMFWGCSKYPRCKGTRN